VLEIGNLADATEVLASLHLRPARGPPEGLLRRGQILVEGLRGRQQRPDDPQAQGAGDDHHLVVGPERAGGPVARRLERRAEACLFEVDQIEVEDEAPDREGIRVRLARGPGGVGLGAGSRVDRIRVGTAVLEDIEAHLLRADEDAHAVGGQPGDPAPLAADLLLGDQVEGDEPDLLALDDRRRERGCPRGVFLGRGATGQGGDRHRSQEPGRAPRDPSASVSHQTPPLHVRPGTGCARRVQLEPIAATLSGTTDSPTERRRTQGGRKRRSAGASKGGENIVR